MSDTPRTDSCYQQILDEGLGLEYAEDELREWSKKLERELAAAIASFNEERERAQREGTRVIKLQDELAEARKDAERLLFLMNQSGEFYYRGYGYQMTGKLREYIDAAMKEGK